MAAAPFKVEDLPVSLAQARIKQIGAIYQAKDSTPARHVYYVARTKTWIVFTMNANGTARLAYSQGVCMLTAVVVLGLAAFFTTSVIRRLPVVAEWTLTGVKPWACNLCMAFWTSLVWTIAARYDIAPPAYVAFVMTWAASAGIALIMLEWSESLVPTGRAATPGRLMAMKLVENGIPRRVRIDLLLPAENAIREAVVAVEALGADPRLTDIVVKLGRMRDALADYVEAVGLA